MESTLTISAFVFGLTQIVKDLGWVKGHYLKLAAVLFGGIATYLSLYHADLWQQLSGILIAAGITGGVSFINEKTRESSPTE